MGEEQKPDQPRKHCSHHLGYVDADKGELCIRGSGVKRWICYNCLDKIKKGRQNGKR